MCFHSSLKQIPWTDERRVAGVAAWRSANYNVRPRLAVGGGVSPDSQEKTVLHSPHDQLEPAASHLVCWFGCDW